MASLALKALSYGAEKIPDRFFEAIPGGYFKPKEDKHDSRRKSKSRSSKYRSQSEGRGRKRSPYPEEYSDEDSTAYAYTDEESDREHRRHRHSRHRRDDRHRAREGRRRHRSLSEDRDSFDDGYILPPPKVDMSKSLGGQNPTPYFPPPPIVSHAESAPASATYSPAQPRPYNPADYSPAHLMASSEQPSPHSLPVNTRIPAPSPVVPQHDGHFSSPNRVFPPPPSRSSRASSVESRGYNPNQYIPHSNVYGHGHKPPAIAPASYQPGIHTPPYTPQQSSPYQPNYSLSYAPAPYKQTSLPVSRTGSISHGSGGHGHHRERNRRHSIATNPPAVQQYPYRTARVGGSQTSSANSRRSSIRNSVHDRIEEGIDEATGQLDGFDDGDRAIASTAAGAVAGGLVGNGIGGSDVGTLVEAAVGGISAAEAQGRRESRRGRARRTYSYGRRRRGGGYDDGYDSY